MNEDKMTAMAEMQKLNDDFQNSFDAHNSAMTDALHMIIGGYTFTEEFADELKLSLQRVNDSQQEFFTAMKREFQ